MVCPNCGRETPAKGNFCVHCKAFLKWDESPDDGVTTVLTPVTPPANGYSDAWDEPISPMPVAPGPGATATDAVSSDRVVVVIGLPDDQPVNVDAGGQATFVGSVSNESAIVDSYDLSLRDLPANWWTIVPPTVYLVPLGSESGTHEQDVTIRLHPPRSSEARAGFWSIELVAVSQAKKTEVGSAHATMVIAPYEAFESRLLPQRVRGKRFARYDVPVLNSGNAELQVRLRGEDADGEARFAFDPPQLLIARKGDGGLGEAHSRVTASARRPLFGVERERLLTVFVDSPTQTLSGAAVFLQRPWITRRLLLAWRVVLTLLAVSLLIGGAFLDWSDTSSELKGACVTSDSSRCMRYDNYLRLTRYVDEEECSVQSRASRQDCTNIAPADATIPAELLAPFNFATSLGFLTIILGVVALVGARSGTFTWLAGAAAVLVLVVYFVTLGDTSGEGAWVAFAGGICALAAGILAAASRG
jgi:hypothetical protein